MRVPLQVSRVGFRSSKTMCYLVLTLLSSAWLLAPPLESRQGPESAARGTAKAITVWKVGSPYREDAPDTAVPTDLGSTAEELGYKLRIESFPARGFAERFLDSFAKNQQPDILVIDSYGLVDGISTPLGTFKGIGSNQEVCRNLVKVSESLEGLEGPKKGWEFLIHSSNNYEGAKSLALRSPHCNASWQNNALTEALRPFVVRIGSAYIEGAASLGALEDPERLYVGQQIQEQRKVLETKECGYWGNDHLAFVPTIISFESAQELGSATVVLALRRQESEWRLLVASKDPVTTTAFLSQMPKFSRLLQKSWSPGSTPLPAELGVPNEGQFPEPLPGQRFGEFTWQSSSSPDVVAEIVEFAYKDDARLILEFRSDDSRIREQVSAGVLWTTHSSWKWRVWSITETGAVSFSWARSFPN